MSITTVNTGDVITAAKMNDIITALNKYENLGLLEFGQLSSTFKLPTGGTYAVIGAIDNDDNGWAEYYKSGNLTYSGGTTLTRNSFNKSGTDFDLVRVIYFRVS